MMSDDMELVREFAAQQSERAFETLVSRHVNLVYSAALRQVRDSHLAEEIAQAVFILLARKAGSLNSRTILSGWLYRTARFVSADALKIQRRRQLREQEAHMQSIISASQTEPVWEQMSPLLDEAMAQLRDQDRDAVVLRFFENKSLREVGDALGLEERAAQKRIHRAVEKLRNYFSKRGVASTSAIITAAISAHSIQAAPMVLAKSISFVAIAKGAAATSTTLTLIQGALKIMAWTKAKTAIVSAVIVAGVATPLVIQHQANVKLREENSALRLHITKHSNDTAPADTSELGRLDREKSELLRLRDEVGRLRVENQKLANVRVAEKSLVPVRAQKPEQNKLPKESWADAGFATPEAALQTRGWTVLNADRERFKESVFITDDGKKVFEDMLEQMIGAAPDPEKARQDIQDNGLTFEDALLFPMIGQNKNVGLAGYEILSRQSPSAEERVYEVETQMVSGKPHQETMKFRRIGNEWKVVIDAEMITANLKRDAK